MTFSVNDLHELARLLRERPEWRAEIRRLVLADELLGLPGQVSALEEGHRRVQEELKVLAEAQRRTEEALKALAEAQRRADDRLGRLEQAVRELAEAQRRTDEQINRLNASLASLEMSLRAEISKLEGKVDDLRGFRREMEFRQKAAGILGHILKRVRVWPAEQLAELAANGLEEGRITLEEHQDLLLADAVVTGRRHDNGEEVSVAVEVSVTVDADDVDRAADRAAILAKLIPGALAAVAGERITAGAIGLAGDRRVIQIIDGRINWP